VRHGTDVATALGLGARAMFVGRPIMYALACDGADGVQLALDLLGQELSWDSTAATNRSDRSGGWGLQGILYRMYQFGR
jgi:FMN-dependent dehydrogenase